jgi:hypothetical protein
MKVAVLAISPTISQTKNGANSTSLLDKGVNSAEGATRLPNM